MKKIAFVICTLVLSLNLSAQRGNDRQDRKEKIEAFEAERIN